MLRKKSNFNLSQDRTMSISDKKNDIINTIKSTKDEQLIEEVYHILHQQKV
jgi:hypothetical protein